MDKPVRWLVDKPQTPPWGNDARRAVGLKLRILQQGESIGMPDSRPMPSVTPRVHELRLRDSEVRAHWRVFYRIDPDAIVVIHWFDKNDNRTPRPVIELVRARVAAYDRGRR